MHPEEGGIQEQLIEHDIAQGRRAQVLYSVFIAWHTCETVDFEIAA
ncbi:hypothetical protein U8D42_26640 [Mycobacterium europaeum]|jgi:hypothetical protein|uniref:Uncharacterized protein n=3 Tax=Mycobacterium TaxID=1763 RepID=D5P1Z4_9MYCO|nr:MULTISPECIES: hypothetical protein [Mycobacterium]EFG79904.1 hypothetical protein HMPREF0591_0188 [Mycobacterium parascrofulaceum ATCC BAA-614]ETZ40648.1 hypothetical protein L842_5619 [Mycobacterium intracellulare MIN_052511_1280]KDO98381.1 hypothetical protein MAV100_26835 [Mycobacterium avium subsp. hominissuis 100]MCA2312554.1 hypothetical protein [Mycobacterium intracellulare subsp. chimaera]MCA2323220.1 hypothetical protein [Mycobacterium intracellulare]